MTSESIQPTSANGGRYRLMLFGVLALTVVAMLFLLPVKLILTQILNWTQGIGFWGYPVLVLTYVIATVFFIPGSLLTLAAGFLFGVVAGSITVSIGSTLGATVAFLVGRHLTREFIERWISSNAHFTAVDQAVGKQGFKMVLLTRLSPVFPFNLLNYAFGLTRVRFWVYVLASWLGMIPGTVMYVYLGSTANDLTQLFAGREEVTFGQQVLKLVGLIATITVTILVTRIARKSFGHTLDTTG
jgi:uncharacterized membrane protein YdjX (TVP38/TMEM64 family)